MKYKLRDTGALRPSRDYAAELNPQQYAAVSTLARHALVIAGAGSGKTRTLTYRVAWLLDQGVKPWSILLLTFTNKAAREMLSRVQDLTSEDARMLWGGTFHSISNRILRQHAKLLGYASAFTIFDSDDQSALMKALIKKHGPKEKAKSQFPKANVLLGMHSLAANTLRDWMDVLLEEYGYLGKYVDEIGAIYKDYAQRKKESNAMDFDDLLVELVRLFEENPALCHEYQQRFTHVLVDEYQDTNPLQDKLITLMTGGDKNSLMVVGDDAQSIYSWRGARVEHIFNFQEQYPEAELFKIETNYRSVPAILEISNAAIALNSRQYAKELRPQREKGSLQPAVIPVPNQQTEALFVAQRIDELMGGGIAGKDIVVLYRAHFHSMKVQQELTRNHIPYRITSGVRFFEQAHVKDVVAFLRLMYNPKDEIALLRIVSSFAGVGVVTANRIVAAWQAALPVTPEGELPCIAGRYAALMGKMPAIKAAQKPQWQAFIELMDRLHQVQEQVIVEDDEADSAPQELLSPGQLVKDIVAYLMPYLEASYENLEERMEDLIQLPAAVPHAHTLDEFLSEMALLTEADKQEGLVDDDCITLSTIHQAKGLEWKVVFILSLGDGLFPHRKIIENGNQSAMEEETRLFYVAVTRAEDQLYLLYPRYSGGYDGQYVPPSRFLTALPSELVELWDCQ